MSHKIIFRDKDMMFATILNSLSLELGLPHSVIIKNAISEFYDKHSKNPTEESKEQIKQYKQEIKRTKLNNKAKMLYDLSNTYQRILTMLSKEHVSIDEIYNFKNEACEQLSNDIHKEGWEILKKRTKKEMEISRKMILRLKRNNRLNPQQLKFLTIKELEEISRT